MIWPERWRARPPRAVRRSPISRLPAPCAAPEPEPAPEPDDPVLRALGHDPLSLDALIDRCGWQAPALSARLFELELDGQVARLPGGLYQRRHTG